MCIAHKNPNPLPTALRIAAVALAWILVGCSTYQNRVTPIPLPSAQADAVNVGNVLLVARAYLDRKQAKERFGFDIRDAGLLPVRLVIDNQGQNEVRVMPHQTFLVDAQGEAWPLLSADQAYRRVRGKIEIGETLEGLGTSALLMGGAGALAGFALGILVGENVGDATLKGAAVGASIGALSTGAFNFGNLESEIRRDLSRESLRNQRIGRGELAYGYLFFPGKDEAKSAQYLRLSLQINGAPQIVAIPLQAH
ncbi:MAG: hypothetical protein ABFS02_02395 [Pseudomonadota bacterium]